MHCVHPFFFHSFVRFVEAERAPSVQNIDSRMVMKKMIGYAVGVNDYSPLQILRLCEFKYFTYIFPFSHC